MKGTVFKRKLPSGRITWGYSIDIGKDENGKRHRKFESGFDKKGEADDALRKALDRKDEGALAQPSQLQ